MRRLFLAFFAFLFTFFNSQAQRQFDIGFQYSPVFENVFTLEFRVADTSDLNDYDRVNFFLNFGIKFQEINTYSEIDLTFYNEFYRVSRREFASGHTAKFQFGGTIKNKLPWIYQSLNLCLGYASLHIYRADYPERMTAQGDFEENLDRPMGGYIETNRFSIIPGINYQLMLDISIANRVFLTAFGSLGAYLPIRIKDYNSTDPNDEFDQNARADLDFDALFGFGMRYAFDKTSTQK